MPEQPWKWGRELDAVAAAPDSHRVLLENSSVRVIEVMLPPGHREPAHTHEWPSVMIVDSSTAIRYYDAEYRATDYPARSTSPQAPFVEWLGPEGPHAVENLDRDRTYHAIRIELKNGGRPL